MGGPDVYFEDLLTGNELSEGRLIKAAIGSLEYRKQKRISKAGVIKDRTFPQLESLVLTDYPLREDRLFYVAAVHQQSLRTPEMHKMVSNATPGQTAVEGLADICKDYLPNLTHLALSKIDLYDLYESDLDKDTTEAIASIVRWDKGEGGGGDRLVRHA